MPTATPTPERLSPNDGPSSADAHAASGHSGDGEWFAFITDTSDAIIGHYDKALVGTAPKDLLSTEIFAVTEEGDWVTAEDVRVWVVGYEGMTFGAVWHRDELHG